MREFIYVSDKARTSGNFGDDLMKAGRMDIVCNVIIQAFFLSKKMREDMHLHLIFNGPPNPPMHLEFVSNNDMPISKKDVGGLIKRMLYKCKKDEKSEIFPGCFIEKKSFKKLVDELNEKGKKILVLDKDGEDIREMKLTGEEVFIIGDQKGLNKTDIKYLKNRITIGKETYFASQTFVIIHNELDRRKYKE
jgi:tRNA pseudouridine-54 N-methylase